MRALALLVVLVASCKPAAWPSEPGAEVFSLHTVSTPCPASGCPTSDTTVTASGEIVQSGGSTRVVRRIFAARLDEARALIAREAAAARAEESSVHPAIPDLSVGCRAWLDGSLYAFRDPSRCMSLESRLLELASPP